MFIISDLDGTLALIEHRRHFIRNGRKDWDSFFAACVDDEPNWPVIQTILSLAENPANKIEIWSGRSDIVRRQTEDWLNNIGLGHLSLTMRSDGDYTPDDQLKEQWLLRAPQKPDLIFDDRDKVVSMWRSHGIVCAQVAPGDF